MKTFQDTQWNLIELWIDDQESDLTLSCEAIVDNKGNVIHF